MAPDTYSQFEACIALARWQRLRRHYRNHGDRLAQLERWERDPYSYEQQLRRVSEVIAGDD